MDDATLKKLIGPQHMDEITSLLDDHGSLPADIKMKNPMVTLMLSIFLGMLGIDRLYQGGVKVFLCKLAMVLLSLGTWWLVDIGYSISMTQEENYNRLLAAAGA